MSDVYGVTLKIEVGKGEAGEVIESEVFFFDGMSFAVMSLFCSEFFELIKKLQKVK